MHFSVAHEVKAGFKNLIFEQLASKEIKKKKKKKNRSLFKKQKKKQLEKVEVPRHQSLNQFTWESCWCIEFPFMSNLLAFGGISARSSFRQEIAKAKCYGFLKYQLQGFIMKSRKMGARERKLIQISRCTKIIKS